MQKIVRNFFILFIIISPVFFVHAQPEAPENHNWELVESLTDEFDTWDSNKWKKSLWNYGEPVQMRSENSGVENGHLWIKATLDEGAVRWFETSRVMSTAQIKYPMYTECRMRTAHISAYNTFWMNNGDIDNRDEIDMCENNSNPSDLSTQENIDRPYYNHSQYFLTVNGNDERAKANFDNRLLSDDNPGKGVKWNEDFHTIGVWWKDENTIQIYLDGEISGKLLKTSRNFTRNLNIIWDLWTIDARWSGGIADPEDLKDNNINTMYVDWIHTYTLVGPPNTAPIAEDLGFNIDENIPRGSFVGRVVGSDLENDPLSYRIVGGNALGAFSIDFISGDLTVADSSQLDYESKESFELTIQVSDGELRDTAIISISINDVFEPPLLGISRKESNLNIYPNPLIGNLLTIDAGSNNLSIAGSIYDTVGRKIQGFSLMEGQKIQLRADVFKKKGIYYFQFQDEAGNVESRKVLIQ
ncbi:MAG: cadherin domain-containing protein [Reichenbachiella sp.]